jgi:hypothetical protein
MVEPFPGMESHCTFNEIVKHLNVGFLGLLVGFSALPYHMNLVGLGLIDLLSHILVERRQ